MGFRSEINHRRYLSIFFSTNFAFCFLIFQKGLPHLPVPDLDATLEKYLRCLEPIQKIEEFQQTKNLVEQFHKTNESIGRRLQEMLVEHANQSENYVSHLQVYSLLPSSVLGCRLVVRRYVFSKSSSITDQFKSSIRSSATTFWNDWWISQVKQRSTENETLNWFRWLFFLCRFVSKLISGILDYKVLIDG